MGERFRDDVSGSFRLLIDDELWVGIDLIAGIAGYVVWVAGSGALGVQLASLADYPIAPGGEPTTSSLALVGLLWLVLPAAVGVARVRSRLLNIRGNVDGSYRLDRPGALLVPPAVFVAVVLLAAVAMGTVQPLLLVALVPATLYLLIRTTAYAYRVYAFSHPIVLYVGLFATLIAQAGVLLLYFGRATENGAVVDATVESLGLPIDPFATVSLPLLSAPAGLAVAAGLPVAVAVGYVILQTIAAAIVKLRKPTVRPTRLRTGQRYPPGLEVASNGGSSGNGGKATPARKSAGASGPSSGSTDEAASANGADGGTSTPDAGTATSADDGDASGDETDADDRAQDDADSVSHTRVFTADSGGDDPLSGGLADGEPCPECGATVPADAEQCPACGADA